MNDYDRLTEALELLTDIREDASIFDASIQARIDTVLGIYHEPEAGQEDTAVAPSRTSD